MARSFAQCQTSKDFLRHRLSLRLVSSIFTLRIPIRSHARHGPRSCVRVLAHILSFDCITIGISVEGRWKLALAEDHGRLIVIVTRFGVAGGGEVSPASSCSRRKVERFSCGQLRNPGGKHLCFGGPRIAVTSDSPTTPNKCLRKLTAAIPDSLLPFILLTFLVVARRFETIVQRQRPSI